MTATRDTIPQDQASGANLRAAGFMIGAMAMFAIEDAAIKTLTLRLPVGQVLATLGLLGLGIFWAVLNEPPPGSLRSARRRHD